MTPTLTYSIGDIASICHEANRALCEVQGDTSQVPWAEAPDWQRTSCINGVRVARENPEATPASQHENWLKDKEADGWVYGEVKDPEAKTHPCMVPYDELPPEQRIKDSIFLAVVRSFDSAEVADVDPQPAES
jgi:hypothetical protein